MEKLHPGAKWVFRLRAYWTLFIFAIVISIYLMGIIGFFTGDPTSVALISVIVGLFVIIVVGEIYSTMAYNRWFYEFTPTNLKIERGIIWKRYSNVPYERVQNVDITRGIIARLLGFSTLNIQTAGYSAVGRGGTSIGSEGYIPAVSITAAEKIREFLMKKIGKRQGL